MDQQGWYLSVGLGTGVLRDEPEEMVEFEIADRPDRGGGSDIGGGDTEVMSW